MDIYTGRWLYGDKEGVVDMIDFSALQSLTITDGNVKSISRNGVVIWSANISVTLTSISATYTGGEVAVGSSLATLTGIVVIGIYSDGSTSEITDYMLSGEIVEGENTITVSYGGLTTTFKVAGIEVGLPSTYQQVEWIRAGADVGAYIDLGFAFDSSAEIHMSQWIFATTTAYIFGAAENSGALRCMVTNPYNGKTYTYGSNGTSYISAKIDKNITYDSTNGKRHDFIFKYASGNLSIQNTTTNESASNTTQGKYTMTNNLYLFAQNYNGTARFGAIRQIGSFQYYDKNGGLACDLVPCYRKSDNVVGMYDLITRTFFTNAGSGTFTKGSNVS